MESLLSEFYGSVLFSCSEVWRPADIQTQWDINILSFVYLLSLALFAWNHCSTASLVLSELNFLFCFPYKVYNTFKKIFFLIVFRKRLGNILFHYLNLHFHKCVSFLLIVVFYFTFCYNLFWDPTTQNLASLSMRAQLILNDSWKISKYITISWQACLSKTCPN